MTTRTTHNQASEADCSEKRRVRVSPLHSPLGNVSSVNVQRSRPSSSHSAMACVGCVSGESSRGGSVQLRGGATTATALYAAAAATATAAAIRAATASSTVAAIDAVACTLAASADWARHPHFLPLALAIPRRRLLSRCSLPHTSRAAAAAGSQQSEPISNAWA